MVQVSAAQKVVGWLAFPLSIGILLFVLIWMGKYRDGIVWSTNADEGDPYMIFNLHPILMTIGMIFFPVQGILAYRILPMDHGKSKAYHMVCHIFGLVAALIGLAAVVTFLDRKHLPHFSSLHSWFGIGTLFLFAFQFLFGLLGFCCPKFPFDTRKAAIPVHQFLGILTFSGACISSLLGIATKIFDVRSKDSTVDPYGPEVQLANWMGVMVVGIFAAVVFVVYSQVGKRRGRNERGSVEEVEALTDKGAAYEHDYADPHDA